MRGEIMTRVFATAYGNEPDRLRSHALAYFQLTYVAW